MACTLTTRYLGLELAHPYILAASSMSATVDGVLKAQSNGAAAVVLKSLFEEQIMAESWKLEQDPANQMHPEALDWIEQANAQLGPETYLELVRNARKSVSIPVIASINCRGGDAWIDYARRIEKAGASALELNVGILPLSPALDAQALEDQIISTVKAVRAACQLPIAVKLAPAYTALPALIRRLYGTGIQGVVLFNRLYQLDLNLETLSPKAGPALSESSDYHQALRWTALLSGTVALDIAANGGVHDATTALKLLAAGAQTVQICSAAFRQGYPIFSRLVRESQEWLEAHNYASLEKFRGLASHKRAERPEDYERLQYVKALTGIY